MYLILEDSLHLHLFDGVICICSGYLFSLSHARLIVLIATAYSVYCVKVRVGWIGVFLSINLAFLSNDVADYLLKCFDNVNESTHFEEQKEPKPVMEDDLPGQREYSIPSDEPQKVHACKSSSTSATTSFINQKEFSAKRVVKEDMSSTDEMKRILHSTDHYEALGFPRHIKIDSGILKKEYRKKVDTILKEALTHLYIPLFEYTLIFPICFLGILF